MRKKTKILISVALLLSIPFLIIAINKLTTVFYINFYPNLGKGSSSENYELKKLKTPGFIQSQTANSTTTVVDSGNFYADTLDNTIHTPLTYVTYEGDVYLDTLQNLFRIEMKVGGPEDDSGQGQSHSITFDKKGKVLADRPHGQDSAAVFKNCLLLQNLILPFQPWLNQFMPVYIDHFSKDEFDSGCFNPLRGFGSPNGSGTCYFWRGRGFYKLVYNKEVLKFELEVFSQAFLFSQDNDFSGAYRIKYAEVPERFRAKIDGAFLINEDILYMVSRK